MSITQTALMQQRRDTAANWTSANPTLLAGEIGIESDTNKIKIGDGSTAWTSLAYRPWSQVSAYPFVNADIASAAAIAYSKLATLTSGNIVLGSSANVATSTAVTGDVTISNTGVTAIATGVIVNADVNASAAIAGTKISPDFGAQNITTTGNITINSQGDVRFGDADSSNYVGFQAPASIAANILWTLPNSDAAVAGYALVSNAAGALSWAEAGGGGAKGGGTDKVFFENDQTVTTSYTITANKNAISAGVVSINASAVVTIPANANWVVV